ncbi:DUF115 domain-containing protein [Paenibacillus albus]|uniref:DUF115 domain-containing protein n=2 Tax=Paenibacillus albus TaxID=2495582 RepID=A0A3S8ZYE5_9BACL|nr:DUF115 domain-containing protein [Paenibacillus albus]
MMKANGDTAIIVIPVYDRIDPSRRVEFSDDAIQAAENYANERRVYQVMGMQWTKNILFNFPANISTPSLRGLKGRLSDQTAVIVGAGPSLEQDIEQLRRLENRAFIIAAGSSSQVLNHFQIKPHLIVTMDGGEANLQAFEYLNTLEKQIPILYIPQIEYRIIQERSHLMHAYFENDSISRYFMELSSDDPIFASSHSVTGTAIQAAAYMGCTEIVFAGQDLSFAYGTLYAAGANHVSKELGDQTAAHGGMTVNNVKGTVNATSQSLLLTLSNIEELIAQYREIRFINTTAMGAVINGTEWQPLKEIADRFESKTFTSEYLEDLFKQYLGVYSKERVEAAKQRVLQLSEDLMLIENLLFRISKKFSKLSELSRTNQSKCVKLMQEIVSNWDIVVSNQVYSSLFTMVYYNEQKRFIREIPELEVENNIIKKAVLLTEVLGGYIKAIQVKLPELKDIAVEARERVVAMMTMESVG